MRASVFAAYVCVVATRTSNRSLSCWCWWRPKPGCVSVHTIAGFAHTHTHAHAHREDAFAFNRRASSTTRLFCIHSERLLCAGACVYVGDKRAVGEYCVCLPQCVCVRAMRFGYHLSARPKLWRFPLKHVWQSVCSSLTRRWAKFWTGAWD